jgi:hypothetical protein
MNFGNPLPGDTNARQADGQPYPVTVSPVEGLVIHPSQGGPYDATAAAAATGTVSVSLPSAPSADVTVTATVIDQGYGLTVTGGASLTFTPENYSTPQTVTFTASATVPPAVRWDTDAFWTATAGSFRVLFSPSGTDVPGFRSTEIRVQVS